MHTLSCSFCLTMKDGQRCKCEFRASLTTKSCQQIGFGSILGSLGCVVLMNDFSSIVPFSRMVSSTLPEMGMDN